MEDYTPRDVIKTLKAILPKRKTRKRSFIDKRNYSSVNFSFFMENQENE